MKKSCYKKILVYGIFILLIGAGVVPSITGNTEKTSIQSIGEAPIGIPLNDDYVNAYWKFDECSGDTVGDSSSPYYHGIRHGASWTTDGHSGCALVFDGVNDYVNLSSYSQEIMFNRTDDVIISFHFKSTGEGIIFSGTAPWGFHPDFRIQLFSNGTLYILIHTQTCGVPVWSNGSYNDGDWHFVEYYFNGISTNPTGILYVDYIFDNSATHYLCEIDSVDFGKAKIGMHAYYSTDYFDGYIDEFKMIKYEQGNKQSPPVIDGPTNGKPNVEYDYSFITDDPEGDDILWLYIDWDDGTVEEVEGPFESGEEVIVSHKWDEESRYDIIAKSEDFWSAGPWSYDPYPVYIGNQPPDPPTITGPKYGDPQQQLTYTFVADDFDEDDVKYFIDWDDGTTTETGYYASGTPITETHSWETKNDYNITARAIDTEDKVGDWSEPYHIRIGDQPPSKPDIEGPSKGNPGTNYKYVFTAVDPENDQVWYEIKWGDEEETTDGPFPSGTSITKSHAWNETGTYEIQARAKDTFDYYGEWADYTVTIPRNRALNFNLLEWLFERFPCTLPIIRCLLDL